MVCASVRPSVPSLVLWHAPGPCHVSHVAWHMLLISSFRLPHLYVGLGAGGLSQVDGKAKCERVEEEEKGRD